GQVMALQMNGKLSKEQGDQAFWALTNQKFALMDLRKKIGARQPYFIRGTFVSRENSATFPVRIVMHVEGRDTTVQKLGWRVMAYDTTLDPGNPGHHPGEGWAPATMDNARAVSEHRAVEAMLAHFHEHNSYPDGSLHLAIKLIQDDSIVERTIDTHNG